MPLTVKQRFGIAIALSMPSQLRATVEGRLDEQGNFTPDQSHSAGNKELAYGRLTKYLSDNHGIGSTDVDVYKTGILDVFDNSGLINGNGIKITQALNAFYQPNKPCPGVTVEGRLMDLNLSD